MKPGILEAHQSHILGLSFSSDDRLLLSAGMDNLVRSWTVGDWQASGEYAGHSKSVNALALTADGTRLVTGSSDCEIFVWSFPQGKQLQRIRDRKQPVAALALDERLGWIAAGSYGGRASVWTFSGEPVAAMAAGKKNLSTVRFNPAGTLLATGGLGDDIQLWSMPAGGAFKTLQGHQVAITALIFYQGGRRLVSLGYEQTIRIWETENWTEAKLFKLLENGARGLTLAPGEQRAALSLEGRIQLWDAVDWEPLEIFEVGPKSIGALAFSHDGRWLAAGAADGRIRIWQLK